MAEPAYDLDALRTALARAEARADDAEARARRAESRARRAEGRARSAEARVHALEAEVDEAEARALRADTHTALCEARARQLGDVSRRYRALLAALPDTFLVVFDQDLRYQVVEGAGLGVLGMDGSTMEGRTLGEIVRPPFSEVLEQTYRRTLAGHSSDQEIPWGGRHHLVQFRPISDGQGTITGGMVVARDLTRIRQAEAALRREQERLQQALAQREVLIREVYHRVKNNLQVVSSLLSLQARGVSDPSATAALTACRARVSAMARVHERLYQGSDLSRIAFGPYVEALTDELVATYRQDDTIEVVVETDDVRVDLETAIPCGLILHEWVANALQHAWPDGGDGQLAVRVRETASAVILEVQDDGIGAPETVAHRTLGTRLVRSLAGQAQATLTRVDAPGTWWRIAVPRRAATPPVPASR